MDNRTKEQIIDRLHAIAGICQTCRRKECKHGNTTLPTTLKTDDVLRAINVDEHFFKEDSGDEKNKT